MRVNRARLRFVFGSSVCLASLPSMAFAGTHQIPARRPLNDEAQENHSASIFVDAYSRVPSRIRHNNVASSSPFPVKVPVLRRLFRSAPQRVKPKVKLRFITVHSGDTLWGISKRYGVSLTALEQWNHLSLDGVLQLGQRIQIISPNISPSISPAEVTSHPSTRLKPTIHTAPPPKRLAPPLSNKTSHALVNLASGVFGAQVVHYAQRFLGVPYRWAGESPRTGFDCSGLVQYVFAHFGIYLARTSYAQFQSGHAVYQVDLLPGDLVFFDTYGPGASHVGIYIGNKRFISAAGASVRIASLNQSYWQEHYLGARRLDVQRP